MSKFIIEPHFRLQEWIAHEKGYFADEGLDYEFRELVRSSEGKHHNKGDKVGAFQSFEKGRTADVSCACHWTVNVAASNGHGRMSRDFTYVADAVEAVTRLLPLAPAGEPVHPHDTLSPAAPWRVVNIANGAPAPLADFIAAF